jgi:proline iminopeptidase
VLEIIGPLYWHRFDAEFDARAFARTLDSAEAYEAGGSLIEGWDLTPRLGEIEAPTLIVVGRDDFVTPPSQARTLREGISHSALIVLGRSGHMPWLEEPNAFFGAPRGWVERT